MRDTGWRWRGITTLALLAGVGLAVPALPSGPAELRLLALAGAGLMLVGLGILTRVIVVRE
ncbi:hypothetical protein JQS43_23965 [Natronosporangium hydrolyticum]|uniref:Uncharacterized protein n=1 Tax=Natronosporangium hydrolyticum TaxID=2811111 RepID=A0A895YK70_9ACTN|nr:hypothetical protein [Natronosporangium hydrolyticum]QSB14500.1 hypothetical protein JQS43_23965 [Natronosporangium hydrolyticum]